MGQPFSTEGHLIVNYRCALPLSILTRVPNDHTCQHNHSVGLTGLISISPLDSCYHTTRAIVSLSSVTRILMISVSATFAQVAYPVL